MVHIRDILKEDNSLVHAAQRVRRDPYFGFPILLSKFKLTAQCNLKCQMCTYWQSDRGEFKELPQDRMIDAITKLAQRGLRKVHFSGGEILLYRHLNEVVCAARNLDLQVNLTTNGTLIDRELADFLVRQRVHTINISLDSAAEKVHNTLRGRKDAFKRTIKGIETLLRLRQKKGRGPKININTIVTRRNIDSMHRMYELIREIGVDHWRLLPIDTLNKKERPNLSQWQTLFAHLQQWDHLMTRLPLALNTQNPAHKAAKGQYAGRFYEHNICYAPWFNFFVDTTGFVYPCCMGKMHIRAYGNLITQDIDQILDSRVRREILTSFATGHCYDICKSCDDFLEENSALNDCVEGRVKHHA